MLLCSSILRSEVGGESLRGLDVDGCAEGGMIVTVKKPKVRK
jgi:hypothetical protein